MTTSQNNDEKMNISNSDSHQMAEHHKNAAKHNEEAAKHHNEAAKHHKHGEHDKAFEHSSKQALTTTVCHSYCM